MTRVSLANPLAVLMVCIAVILFSVTTTSRLSVDTFPELTPPVLIVGTLASGLGPKDVEKTITWRLEKVVAATPGVDHVQSESRASMSVIYVWLKWGTDLNAAQSLVQQQVAFAMSSVPKSLGVLPPFIIQYDPSNAPVLQVAVYGEGLSPAQVYDYATNNISPLIEGIPGVASASANGGRERQVNVVVDPGLAEARGVTASEVAAAVGRTNALLPSGRLLAPGYEANVYTNAIAPRVEEIGQGFVKRGNAGTVLVRDVAEVKDGGSLPNQFVSVDGKTAVYLNIMRVPGGNTLEIVEQVKKVLAGLQNKPPGMEVVPIFDQSTFVRNSFGALKHELIQATILIALVILIFLQSPRSVLIALISAPLAFACILIALYATGQTLNAFTIGGLTLAVGPLVDISVVVLEAIHRKRHEGHGAGEAAILGARSVATAMFSATLCTLAVLLPIALLTGLARKLFTPLAVTVAVGMLAGLLVSLTVTPVACRYLLGHSEPGPLARRVARVIERLGEAYARALRAVLPVRGVAIGAMAVLVAVSLAGVVRLPATFFPEIDESMERVYVRLPPGTSLDVSSARLQQMADAVTEQLPAGLVRRALVNVGAPSKARSKMGSPNLGPHMGFLRFELVPPEERDLSQREVANRIRAILDRDFPGVETLQAPGGLATSIFGEGYLAPLVVQVRGQNQTVIREQLERVAEVAREVVGIRDPFPTLQVDYPEIRVDTDRQLAGEVGLDMATTAQTTLEATLGNINRPAIWVDGSNGQSYYVVTAYDRKLVRDVARLTEVPVPTAGNGAVPLGAYSEVRREVGPTSVERDHLMRVGHLLMQTEGRDLGSAADELERRLKSDPRTRDIDAHLVGQAKLMRDTFSGLAVAIGLAIFVVFTVLVAQFKSLRLPFVLLVTMPGTLIGIVIALLAAGQPLSIPALMGFLMVLGIAVSNGILLVDHANKAMAAGAERVDAIIEAGRVRLTPILMTSCATIVGLLPTALGLQSGTEANRPLALAVVGGLASSTALSLFIMPCLFVLLAREPRPEHAQEPQLSHSAA